MSETKILRAVAADAAAISRLASRTFAETFVGLAYYTQELIDGYTAKAFAPETIAAELASPHVQYFLATRDGEPVAYAKVMVRDRPPCITDPHAIYLERLYVAKGAKGSGLGRRLVDLCYATARGWGGTSLWLSVWEHNEPAQEFYKKLGFARVGAWDWPFESGGQRYVDLDYLMTIRIPHASARASI
jgi:ribosomal protein S18 acetylase RimI-like enzyme